MSTLNRRGFLQMGCSLLSSASIINSITNLKLATAASLDNNQNDYKALVCVFLFGGNDSYNMLIPSGNEEYQQYKKARSNLALDLHNNLGNGALPLSGLEKGGRKFAVHPMMNELQKQYDKGSLAFLANTGTLAEPTNISQYNRRSVKLPTALFSHNDQRDHWQTGIPNGSAANGWVGRATDLLQEHAGNSFSAISLSGNNVIQTGESSTAYVISSNGSIGIKSQQSRKILQLLQDQNKLQSNNTTKNILSKAYQHAYTDSRERHNQFSVAFASSKGTVQSPEYNSRLARKLNTIARTIAARKTLGVARQTFFVLAPGWDNHRDLLADHALLLADLSKSLNQFQATLENLGVSKQVTTFTASDFGRTLSSNGRGSDHAWGGNQIVMGGAVNGGRIYGTYPESLLIGDGLDIGSNGRLLPTTSCDEYFAELLMWYGVPASSLDTVLPNIYNFVDKNSVASNLGIMM